MRKKLIKGITLQNHNSTRIYFVDLEVCLETTALRVVNRNSFHVIHKPDFVSPHLVLNVETDI